MSPGLRLLLVPVLAVVSSVARADVLLVDVDPQGTSSEWLKSRRTESSNRLIHKNLEVTATPWISEDLTEKLKTASQEFTFTLIDCGPANDKTMRAAFVLSDFTLIPVTPSPYDIRSVKKTIDMIQEGRESGATSTQPFLVISRKVAGTTLGREARETLTTFHIPILQTEIGQRVALCEAGIVGCTVHEYAPGSQAAIEFDNLGKEVRQWQKQNSPQSPKSGLMGKQENILTVR